MANDCCVLRKQESEMQGSVGRVKQMRERVENALSVPVSWIFEAPLINHHGRRALAAFVSGARAPENTICEFASHSYAPVVVE
jgi:hypothetical protein